MLRKKFLFIILLCLCSLALPFRLFADAKSDAARRLLEKRNLLALPNVSGHFNSDSPFANAGAPFLKDLESILKNIFWTEIEGLNVIDALVSGVYTAPICQEFLGLNNGVSAGLGGCYLSEAVTYSYSQIIKKGEALCYMQKFPAKDNLKSGAVVLQNGKLPRGGIESIFSTPGGGRSRVVKVNLRSGSEDLGTIYVEVPSTKDNRAAGLAYSANLWSCAPGSGLLSSYDRITVSRGMKFTKSHTGNSAGEAVQTKSDGRLRRVKGRLEWNGNVKRRSYVRLRKQDGSTFKADIELGRKSDLKLRHAANNGDKGFILARYSGGNAENIRFIEGAFNEVVSSILAVNSVRYREDQYIADNNQRIIRRVKKEDLNSEFYTTEPEIGFNQSAFACTAEADIELTVDISSEPLQASVAGCDLPILPEKRYCVEDPAVALATVNFFKGCLAFLQ